MRGQGGPRRSNDELYSRAIHIFLGVVACLLTAMPSVVAQPSDSPSDIPSDGPSERLPETTSENPPETPAAPAAIKPIDLKTLLKNRPNAPQVIERMRERARRGVQDPLPPPPGALNTKISTGPPPPVPDPLPAIYAPQPAEPGKCPNVVLIILDTTRPDKLGCYGYGQRTSPGLDQLAKRGVVFENVLAQASWTRPSIGSLLTSRYPRELGLYVEKDQILPDEHLTLAEILKAEGYYTIGLTANPNINKYFNFDQGFDEYVDSDILFFWMPVVDGKLKRGVSPLPSASDMFNNALRMINDSGNQGPYYLQFDLMEVHEWLANRPGTNMQRREYASLFDMDSRYSKYPQMIRQVTDDLSQFVDQLRALPGWDDTIFIFTSDHGEGLGDHPGIERSGTHGFTLYESVTRVPWIIYREGWHPARDRIQQEVRLLDVVPTLLTMLGIPAPEEMKGISMLPVIEGRARVADIPRYQVIESEFGGMSKIALYGKRFKYIENRIPHSGLPPRELQPRGGHERGSATSHLDARPEIVDGMKHYLDEWELQYPRKAPTAPYRSLTPEETEQLQNIGYL